MAFIKKLPALAATAFVRFVSAFFRTFGGRACRFSPSCSEYSSQAFGTYGFFAACRLTAARVLRCHPFTDGGYDPLVRPAGR